MSELISSRSSGDVRLIQEMAEVSLGIRDVGATPFIILPDGYKAESLEPFKDEPTRHRATYSTSDLSSFLAYLEVYADDESIVAIRETGSAKAVIDYGTKYSPAWGNHLATFTPANTPEMVALRLFCGRPQTQKEVVEYLEDWGDLVTPLVEGNSISIPQAIAAFRRVKISSIAETGREEKATGVSRSAMEQIEAKSIGGELPTRLMVNCALWEGFDPVDMEVAISLRTAGEKPEFAARIIALPAITRWHTAEVARRIQSEQDIRSVLGELHVNN